MSELTLGQRIAQERKNLGLSQEALGEKLGVSRQAISKWESDGAIPEIDKLIALSKLFSTDLNALLGVSAPPEPPAEPKPTVPKTRPRPTFLLWLLPVVVCLFFLWQIVCLYNLIESVQIDNLQLHAEIYSLRASVDALAVQEEQVPQPGTLLSNYDFDLDLYETEPKLTVTFTGMPYTWQTGDCATLCISGSGIEPKQIPCQWDGAFLTAALVLDITDGYELCLAIDHADGSRQLQVLNHSALNNLKTAFSMVLYGNVRGTPQYREDSNTLELPEIYIEYTRSEDYVDTPVIWQEISLILCLDGEEIARDVQFDAAVIHDSTATGHSGSMLRSGSSFPLASAIPQPGQEISLLLYARQSNGIEATFPMERWILTAEGTLDPQ